MTTLLPILIGTLSGAGAIGALSFIVQYHRFTRGGWRDVEEGMFLMVVSVNLCGLFLVLLANLIFGQWYGRTPIGLIIFIALVALAWWPLRLLYKVNGKVRSD